MRVYIGHDAREAEAYLVASRSLRRRASIPVDVTPIRADVLRLQGLLRRPVDNRGGMFDLYSGAPQSTEFAVSRFLVPMLAQTGYALFVDCDVVFLGDVAELNHIAGRRYAVQVVKHLHTPAEATKMDGAVQTAYARKNWSSVILWNCDHAAHKRLSLDAVNNWPGRDLHAFGWLHDSEIGELPAGWNWLVNVQPQPDALRLAHFTLGGPWLRTWQGAPNDDLWLNEAEA
jgi:lipopolysaccharide biosynthesis glycosyltransferase